MTLRTHSALFVATYAAAYVVAGLFPFDFDFGSPIRVYSIGSWTDVTCNIVAFVPFGFAFAADPLRRRPVLAAALFCTVLALCVEWLQMFVPQRFPQIADVVCNCAGGCLGAWLWPRIAARGSRGPRPDAVDTRTQ